MSTWARWTVRIVMLTVGLFFGTIGLVEAPDASRQLGPVTEGSARPALLLSVSGHVLTGIAWIGLYVYSAVRFQPDEVALLRGFAEHRVRMATASDARSNVIAVIILTMLSSGFALAPPDLGASVWAVVAREAYRTMSVFGVLLFGSAALWSWLSRGSQQSDARAAAFVQHTQPAPAWENS